MGIFPKRDEHEKILKPASSLSFFGGAIFRKKLLVVLDIWRSKPANKGEEEIPVFQQRVFSHGVSKSYSQIRYFGGKKKTSDPPGTLPL